MAQISEAFTLRNCKVEISTNGTNWQNISGYANSIEVSGGERQSGEVFTFDGDTAIITVGKREPLEVTVRVVYDESTSGPFETVRNAYENGTSLHVRWAPRGGTTGHFLFTADPGPVTSIKYPSGEVSGDPIMVEFTVKTPKITKGTVA